MTGAKIKSAGLRCGQVTYVMEENNPHTCVGRSYILIFIKPGEIFIERN